MTRTIKKKGPAKAATSPDHGSHPNGDRKMNTHDDSMAAHAVPIPHPAHSPQMDMASAMSLLRILNDRLMRGAVLAEEAGDLVALLSQAFHLMEPVHGYLDLVEYRAGQQALYHEARRDWVLDRQGGAS